MYLLILLFILSRAQKEIIIRLETLKSEQDEQDSPASQQLALQGEDSNTWQDVKVLIHLEKGRLFSMNHADLSFEFEETEMSDRAMNKIY